MIKKIIVRVAHSYRFQVAGTSSISSYNYNTLKTEHYGGSLIESNRSYSHSSHQNVLTNNCQKILNLQNSAPIQNILRYKTTESTSASKEESTSSKETTKVDITPLTRGDKLKKAVKEYGATVIVFHVGISLISLGTCYLLVTMGLDVSKVFAAVGLEEWVNKSQIATSAGTFAVAYAIHKVFAPARIAITLASVPLIVRYLRRIGFLKK